MTAAHAQPAGPHVDPAVATRALIRAVSLALLVTALLTSAVLVMLGQPDWWLGFAAASALSVLAAMASILALRLGLGFGIQGAIAGHFGGVLVRLLIVLGGGLLLVWIGQYPAATLFLAVPYYFATLAGEVVALARLFWTLQPVPAR